MSYPWRRVPNAARIFAACMPTNFFPPCSDEVSVSPRCPHGMRNGDEWMDVPPSSPGTHGFYQRVVDVAVRAQGQKLAWKFLCSLSRRRRRRREALRSSRQNVVAVRGAEPAAVPAAVRILPFSGEFPLNTAFIFSLQKKRHRLNFNHQLDLTFNISAVKFRSLGM